MAELIHHKPKSKSTTDCFLCCFGFPGQKRQLSMKKSDAKKNNNTLCFSWSRFRIKRSSTTKTVPLDSTVSSEKINLSFNCPNPTKDDHPKPHGLITTATAADTDAPAAAASTVSSHNQSPKETKINKLHQNRRHSDDATSQKRSSFRRRIDSIRTSSHPGSPDTAKPKVGPPNVVISRSTTTSPVPDRVKWVGSPSTQSRVIIKEGGNKLDPIVGMSILTVTLLIMLLWGRLCAILCTSAWFYFVPRMRRNIDNGTNGSGPDLDSEEYKKRVVLEGLLERNHHHHHHHHHR